MEHSIHGYWSWHIPSGDGYLSPNFKNLLGYADDEVPNQAAACKKLIFSEDLAEMTASFRAHADSKGTEPFYCEIRYQHKNGTPVDGICTGKVVTWASNGHPVMMVGCHVDVAQPKQKIDALHEFFNMENYMMCISDLEGHFLEVSNTFKQILGYTREEMLSQPYINFVHPDDVESTLKLVENELASGTRIISFENRYRCKNGSYRWISWTGHPIVEKGVSYSIAYDITDRKQAELALAAEKELLATTLRCIGDGVITTDTEARVVVMNAVAEYLTGWTQLDAKGRPIEEIFKIVHESTRITCENPAKQVLAIDKAIELANHTMLISRDGVERVISDSGAPIKDKDGTTIGVVLVFRDMTEKQKLLESIQLADKLQAIGVLAGGIAHDFNNLLGGIFGYIEMAAAGTREDTTSKHLSKALTAMDRTRHLTGQLLTFAKGGAPIKKLEQLRPQIKETVEFALSGANVSARFHILKSLWPCDIDRHQICQVIDNIVINALQAMPEGGFLDVSAENVQVQGGMNERLPVGNYVKISIRDYGIGMPKEVAAKIFDPFFTTKTEGLGLGLATCYSIVHRHGGALEVESKSGTGSTFYLFLPAMPELSPESTATALSVHSGSGTFMVMDDDEMLRDIIGGMLRAFGYSVVFTKNGEEAVDFVAKAVNADIAGCILDLTIPGAMGGKEAIRRIREIDRDLPTFVASGYAEDPIMANPTDFGFTGSISKPFRKAELAKLLNNHLKSM